MLNKYRFFRESIYLVDKYIHQRTVQNIFQKANPESGEVGRLKESPGRQDACCHGNGETSRREYAEKLRLDALCQVLVRGGNWAVSSTFRPEL